MSYKTTVVFAGGRFMESCLRMDRLSTCNEVCWALSIPVYVDDELHSIGNVGCAIEVASSAPSGILAEEATWFALASEALDLDSN